MISYSTNWMGPINLNWYRERGLLEEGSVEPTTYYSAGRIDIRGVPDEPWGLEYGVEPMHGEDWNHFSDWLDDFETEELVSYNTLIEQFETHYGKRISLAGENV